MKSLAQLRIKDADARIESISIEERDSKIDLLYSLGYVYDPYHQIFYNPFIDQGLKAMVIYNWDHQSIEKFHNTFVENFNKKNRPIKSVEEISKQIYGNSKVSRFALFLESAAGMIGIFFLAVALALNLTENLSLALGVAAISFIFINFYVTHNLLFGRNEGRAQLSRFWYKHQNGLIVSSILIYPYLYYLLYQYSNNLWIPLIMLFALRYLIKKFVKRMLSKQFWQMTGMFSIEEYAEQFTRYKR